MIRRAIGATEDEFKMGKIGDVDQKHCTLNRPRSGLTIPRENRRQFFGRNDFKLGVRAVARRFVRAPAAKLRRVAEAVALHVVVSDFDDQLGTERLPGQILTAAPATLRARHTMRCIAALRCLFGPVSPRVSGKGILSVRAEKFDQLAPLLVREARAHADVLQRAGIIEKAEQQ
jgi:hypothetical protein